MPRKKQKQKKKERRADVRDTISRWYFVLIVLIFAIVSVLMFYSASTGASLPGATRPL